MKWTKEQLRKIYDRTQGKCHICGKKVALKNHGKIGARMAWSVEHSVAQANGGTHHGNNLYAACISCNSSKGARSTRSARAKNGRTGAPLSSNSEARARGENAVVVGGFAGVIGAVIAGPIGFAVGSLLGGCFGHSLNPEDG